ncbi:NAD(P)-dependent oxidoreductase [Paenibacillus sp. CN-4]|uniref:NAD(P)-dependent oxidoreductase n=1 Tax=Paenibacillus nanchangensis TaxID=3348343 RepID=UPI0039785774
MKIVLFGGSGMIGGRILEEALRRGHEVTAALRSPGKLELEHGNLQKVTADVLDPKSVEAAAKGHEAAVSAFGPPFGREEELPESARSLLEGVRAAGASRLLVIGGAGSLLTESGERLMDTVGFPAEVRSLAMAHADAYEIYRNSDFDYTYVSPAAVIEPGRRTGQFRIGLDRLVVDEDGKSAISAEDFAVAVVDELEEQNFSRARFTVGY